MERCSYCSKFNYETKNCPYCEFEYEHQFRLESDDWDILDLDDELEWSHLQILYRLHSQGVECLFADIWFDNNMAYLIGCKSYKTELARVLNIHEDCIYEDFEHGLVFLNLFQEKYIRGLLD